MDYSFLNTCIVGIRAVIVAVIVGAAPDNKNLRLAMLKGHGTVKSFAWQHSDVREVYEVTMTN